MHQILNLRESPRRLRALWKGHFVVEESEESHEESAAWENSDLTRF